MVKPALQDIAHGVESWDSIVNADLAILRDNPMPVKEYALAAALPAAGSFDRCVAFKETSSGVWALSFSDGTTWHNVYGSGQTTEWTGSSASAPVARARVTGDTNPRWELRANGDQFYGPGNAALDFGVGRLSSSAHGPLTDNAIDSGTAGSRWRNVRVAGTVFAGGANDSVSLSVANSTAMRTGAPGTAYYFDLGSVQFRDGDGVNANAILTVWNVVRAAAGSRYAQLSDDGIDGYLSTSAGHLILQPGGNVVNIQNGTAQQYLRVFSNTATSKFIQVTHDGTNGLVESVGPLYFGTDGSVKWVVTGSTGGHLHAVTDAAHDLGGPSNRVRNGYFSGLVSVGTAEAGVVSAPQVAAYDPVGAYVIARDTGDNVEAYMGANSVGAVFASASNHDLILGVGNTARAYILAASNTFEIRAGSAAQVLRVYGDATKNTFVYHNGTDGQLAATSGSLYLTAGAGSNVNIGKDGATVLWQFNETGHVYAGTDNAYDVGGAGASRPRNVIVGTSIRIGSSPAGSGALNFANNTSVMWRNAANDQDLQILAVGNDDTVYLGNFAATIRVGNNSGALLGFYGATPAARTAAYTQTYSTATRTHANFTSADLTGISSSTTGSALAEPSGSYTQSEMQQNFRRIQDQFNALRADVANLKQLANSVIDDQQTYGLFQ